MLEERTVVVDSAMLEIMLGQEVQEVQHIILEEVALTDIRALQEEEEEVVTKVLLDVHC